MIRKKIIGFFVMAMVLAVSGCSQQAIAETAALGTKGLQEEMYMEEILPGGETDSAETRENLSHTTEIIITVGNQVITALLEDSAATRAFLATLPRTLTMNQYGDREYYSRIESITEEGEAIPDFKNGDVTYYPPGPSLAIFYAGEEQSSQSGLIRLGKVISDLSVFGNLGDTVEMQIAVSGL